METVAPERMPGERPFESHAAYEAALDELIANTSTTLRLFENRIGRAFNSPQRYELLRGMLLASRQCRVHIVLHDTSGIVRDCPRLITLARQFSHALFIRQTLAAARRVYDPFAVGDDARFVRRFHYDHMRGTAVTGDLDATRLFIKRFEEIWASSTPAVAATTIGL